MEGWTGEFWLRACIIVMSFSYARKGVPGLPMVTFGYFYLPIQFWPVLVFWAVRFNEATVNFSSSARRGCGAEGIIARTAALRILDNDGRSFHVC
jgi:hypothetical protein